MFSSFDLVSPIIGLGQSIISALLLGSMFVPLKKFDTGDGFFAQWLMNIAILITGFAVYASENFTPFYPIAMLGGAVWSMGNMMALPIIQRLGLALGMLIWNSTYCLTGWAVSHFGLFGVTARRSPHTFEYLIYFGLYLAPIGGALFSLVKNRNDHSDLMPVPLDPESEPSAEYSANDTSVKFTNPSNSKFVINKDRALGIAMALLSGVCYGLHLVPVVYVQDNPVKYPGAHTEAMPCVFSHYCGAFLMSTLGFLVYYLVKKNHPYTNNELILPGFASGIIWAIAQILLFWATQNFSDMKLYDSPEGDRIRLESRASISYPISATMSGCVAAIWSVFYFKEIQGTMNLTILFIYYFFTMGITLFWAYAIYLSGLD